MMKLEVESTMKPKSSGLLPVGMWLNGHGCAVTAVACTTRQQRDVMVVRWRSRENLKPDDAFDDNVEIVGTTIESSREPRSENGTASGWPPPEQRRRGKSRAGGRGDPGAFNDNTCRNNRQGIPPAIEIADRWRRNGQILKVREKIR
jgi:hypothetical protein